MKIFGSKVAEQEENILLRNVPNSTKVNDQPSRLSVLAMFLTFVLSLLVSYFSINRPIYSYLRLCLLFHWYMLRKSLLPTLLRYMLGKLGEYIILTTRSISVNFQQGKFISSATIRFAPTPAISCETKRDIFIF